MKAKQLMSTTVRTCSPLDTLALAAHKMWAADVGCLVVVDAEHKPVAMITDRDIAMAAYLRGAALHDVRVDDAMSKRLLACTPETPLSEIEALMQRAQIRRIPIVGAGEQLVGIVTLADLARDVESSARRLAAMPALAKTLAAVTERRQSLVAP